MMKGGVPKNERFYSVGILPNPNKVYCNFVAAPQAILIHWWLKSTDYMLNQIWLPRLVHRCNGEG